MNVAAGFTRPGKLQQTEKLFQQLNAPPEVMELMRIADRAFVFLNSADVEKSSAVVVTSTAPLDVDKVQKVFKVVPSPMADGKTLYASAGGNNKIRTYSFTSGQLTEGASIALPTTSETGKTINPYPAGIAMTPDGGRLVVADRLADAVTVIDLRSGARRAVARSAGQARRCSIPTYPLSLEGGHVKLLPGH